MVSESYLMNIPELVMNIILDKLDFKSVQTLRKVCRDLRDFIDDQKPDPRIEEITVWALESGDLKFSYKNLQAEVFLCYQTRDGGESVLVYEDVARILKGEENLLKIAFKDFETILKHQSSTLKVLKLHSNHFDNVLDHLKTVLESRNHRLKVETLVTDQVMKILPFLDPDFLLELNLFGSTDHPIRTLEILEIDELAELEIWCKIKELSIWDCYVPSVSLQSFTHFSKCSIDVELVHLEDVLLLKETLNFI
ncbi:hypothetical protein CRE_12941 [Caenorhabditis remanei]|uniref:F-box domain-containing protein n=1 Tax=Caenorhabditis remanei TaxID=31234 RepID=E3N139_CAERE|nr:hypothetical protein CRE_12941 [Caenorhabditis remanei]